MIWNALSVFAEVKFTLVTFKEEEEEEEEEEEDTENIAMSLYEECSD
jgi:hypothetical protein